MKVVVETINSNRANALLDAAERGGQRQRHLSKVRVEKFAAAMNSGQWHLTHQAIGIDKDGLLIDGQHRMAAVVLSNTEQEFLVAYEADPATFDVIDTGAARTSADTLSIAGYANVNQVAAGARILLAYDEIKGTRASMTHTARRFTNSDILATVESPRGDKIIHAAAEAGAIGAGMGRMGARSWLTAAVVLTLESGLNKDVTREFLTKIRTGEMLESGSPILAMRRWMASDHGWIASSVGERQQNGLAVYIKTLNTWLVGERRTVSIFKNGIEVMPEVVVPEHSALAGSDYAAEDILSKEGRARLVSA